MDAFFAAIEERDRPRLHGLPIVVGADPKEGRGRGVVSTANYKAREYGIHSAMPISGAWQFSEKARKEGRSPAVFLSGSFKKYGEVSERIMAIVRSRVEQVQEAGIDEIYMDLSFAGSYEKAAQICREIKEEVKAKERLTASCGIGPNKLVAKIASDMRKPDGLTVICGEDAEKTLEPLPIRKIHGIGPKTEALFEKRGIFIVRELKKISKEELGEVLGKWGCELYDRIRGVDDSPVRDEYGIKSIGEQETFDEDTRDAQFVMERMGAMCASVIRRLGRSDFSKFRTVGITVRFSDFETKTREHTLGEERYDLKTLQFEATLLLMPFFDKRGNPKSKSMRLVGVRIGKLC